MISAQRLVQRELPTHFFDAELCANLCHRAARAQRRINWETAVITRQPEKSWSGVDRVVISAELAQGYRDHAEGP